MSFWSRLFVRRLIRPGVRGLKPGPTWKVDYFIWLSLKNLSYIITSWVEPNGHQPRFRRMQRWVKQYVIWYSRTRQLNPPEIQVAETFEYSNRISLFDENIHSSFCLFSILRLVFQMFLHSDNEAIRQLPNQYQLAQQTVWYWLWY